MGGNLNFFLKIAHGVGGIKIWDKISREYRGNKASLCCGVES